MKMQNGLGLDNVSKFYSVREAASLIGVCSVTILRYIRAGKIQASKPGGFHYRIPEAELAALLEPVGVAEVNDEV